MSAGEQASRTVNPGPRALRDGTTTANTEENPLLDQARDVALRLLSADGRAATALRVRVGDVAVEMEWPEPQVVTSGSSVAVVGPTAAVTEAPTAAEVAEAAGSAEPTAGYLTAHTVGCFYRRPSPDAAPFVAEGEVVSAGQQVAIIEAMKLMLPVEVDQDCRIGEALIGDGQTVEFGDRLFALESLDSPAAGRDET